MVEIPYWVLVLLAVGLVILILLVWSIKRRQDTQLKVSDAGELSAMLPSMVGLSHGVLDEGNSLRIVQNGAFFEEMLRDVAGARQSIHLETYVWWKGPVTHQVGDALAAKAKEGVVVRALLDASGSSRMEDEVLERMTAAGVKVAKFHPVRLSNLGRLNNRDHRKILVIDGKIGWAFGHGIAQEWTGDAANRDQWRDTALRVEGPLVNHFQAVFSENWIEETGDIFGGDEYFPRIEKVPGGVPAHVAYSSPAGSVSSVRLLHLLAVASARSTVLIQNPYFLPDPQDIEIFAAAVKRGVDVRIMLPSDQVTDSAIVQHASHHRFGALLESGVRIFEYKKTLNHQKIMLVDGRWSSVGSTNWDDRSFELNDEITVGILDEKINAELTEAWDADMEHASEWTLDRWKERSVGHKAKDLFSFLFNEQL